MRLSKKSKYVDVTESGNDIFLYVYDRFNRKMNVVVTHSSGYAVGHDYDFKDGVWAHGHYDFKDLEEAVKDACDMPGCRIVPINEAIELYNNGQVISWCHGR